ncbi:MAG TPA: CehA/McbA family metallohydrolase [Polyangiaceae bacterium]|nr:CehA/McbA family metallohydrolase [Polyangiaceae bacterium]
MSVRRSTLVLASTLGAVAVVWFAWPTRPRDAQRPNPKLPYASRGVTISSVSQPGLSKAESVAAETGDWLVQNGRLSFSVGADAAGLERRAHHGTLLDLALGDFNADELVEFRPVVRIANSPLPLNMVGVSLLTEGTFPFLRVDEKSRDGQLEVMTDYLAPPGQAFIEVVTRLHNAGEVRVSAVELGERVRWPGGALFSPRVGFPRAPVRAELNWLAREGAQLTYALVFPRGPVQGSFLFDRVGPVGQETLAQVGDAEPGQTIEHRRLLLVVPNVPPAPGAKSTSPGPGGPSGQGLGGAAALAWKAMQRELGYVSGRIEAQVAWAVVEADYPDGKPALIVQARTDGSFELPLVPGEYRITLRTPGGKDSVDVRVAAGQTVSTHLIAPVPGRLSYSVTDEAGAALPARILLRGVAPTPDPELSASDPSAVSRNVIYSRGGTGHVELPPGHYRAVVSHGSEYEIASQDIEVDGEDGASLRAVLQHSVETGGWLACDFHLHQAPSHDSSVSLPDRVLSLLAEGIEFAVATDHNHVTDFMPAVLEQSAAPMLGVASGVEVTTSSWGHFNAYPYPIKGNPPPFSGVSPIEIFASIRARAPGAVIQVNHPRMPGVGYFNRIELDPQTGAAATEGASWSFDAVEVVNGYDLEANELIQQNLQEYFTLLNFGRRITATGNSDSHRLLINWAGYPRTYVRVNDEHPGSVNPADVARAIVEGHASVSNGIFLAVVANGTLGPGDMVTGRRVDLQVQARAPRFVDVEEIEVWVNGTVRDHTRGLSRASSVRMALRSQLSVDRDAWIVVVARGKDPMDSVFLNRRVLPFAFTNPIYVDADEDGTFRAPLAPELPTAPLAH